MTFPSLLCTIKDGLLYLFSSIFLPISISFIMAGRPIPGQLRVFGESAGESSRQNEEPAEYHPTPTEILGMRRLLADATKLPLEVVVTILDLAEYWAHSSSEIDFLSEHGDPCRVHGGDPEEDKFLLRTLPIGFIGSSAITGMPEAVIYDTTAATPRPLVREHAPTSLVRLCRHPTPSLVNPVRKVVFSTRSRDQGWGGELTKKGLYKSSWTWFEAGLERFDADMRCDEQCTYDVRFNSENSPEPTLPICCLRPIYPTIVEAPPEEDAAEHADADGNEESQPQTGEAVEGAGVNYKYNQPLCGIPRLIIQHNRLATRTWQNHTVTWSSRDNMSPDSAEARALMEKGRSRCSGDGSFVRELKLGDVVTIWAKARFPGWENKVEKVKIEVYWTM